MIITEPFDPYELSAAIRATEQALAHVHRVAAASKAGELVSAALELNIVKARLEHFQRFYDERMNQP